MLVKVFERSLTIWPKIEAGSILAPRGKYTKDKVARKMAKFTKMFKSLDLESSGYNKLKI
jgi:hypothetical protein